MRSSVIAACDVVQKDVKLPGSIGRMIEPIIPAVLVAQRRGTPEQLVERSVEENVRRMVERLRKYSEPMLLQPQATGELKVVGAVYSLSTGAVRWLDWRVRRSSILRSGSPASGRMGCEIGRSAFSRT